MTKEIELCVVCGKKTLSVANGQPVCNGCNLFKRRSIKKILPPCVNGGFCLTTKCRACRLKKCFERVWTDRPGQEERRTESNSPTHNQRVLLENMTVWNEERKRTFLNYKVQNGTEISVQDVMNNGTGRLLLPTQSTTFLEWSFISQLTTIVFLMKLPFYGELSPDDQKSFIKAYRFKSAMFFLAMHCFQNGIRQLQYPNGIDIFSNEISSCPDINPSFLHDIRTKLICKLKELNVTMEEFYIMSGLFVCNTSNIENLSLNGQQTIMEAQIDFQAILLKQSGPLKYGDLIGVYIFIHNTHMYFERAKILSEALHIRMPTKKFEVEDQESVLHFE